jgi:hypothetical protein
MDRNQEGKIDFKGSIAIGPLVGLPSSDWVGVDIANHLLDKSIKIEKFNSYETPIDADYIILVKLMPSMGWLIDKVERGIKVLYAPVDNFHSNYTFWRYRYRLKLFSGFLIHNDRVGKLVSKFSPSPLFFIEHYLKYELDNNSFPIKNNELLWVGHLEYIPSLLKFLKEKKPQIKIRALSDLEKLSHYENYLDISLAMFDSKFSLEGKTNEGVYISGVYIEQWSEEKQDELMQTCIAAFDTKMNSFSHNLKPPTKSQQFIYNKIPFACSEYTFSFEYFQKLGLNVAKLSELDYLVSNAYRDKVSEFCDKQKWRVNINNVASSYLNACSNAISPKFHSKIYFNFMNSACSVIYFSLRIIEKFKIVFRLNKFKG